MRLKIARTGFVVAFAACMLLSAVATAHADDGHRCSLARASGKWSFTDDGTVVGVGPRTAVGILALDAAGNVSNGVATSSLNGAVANETFSGTYTVNSDCTGSISVQIFASGTPTLAVTLNIAFDADMRHLRGIFTSVTTPTGAVLPTVINLDGRRQ